MTLTTYAKWSDHEDRWILWDVDTDNLSAPSNHTMLTGPQYQRRTGLSKEDEYNNRFGVPPGGLEDFVEQNGPVDRNFLTNPALYYPGESSDVAAGKYYGRPVPASAIQHPPLPA